MNTRHFACSKPLRSVRAQSQRLGTGFALVPALFLVVVLGALALVAVRVGSGQQHAVTMGLMQARAMAAARAGVEWGAYQAIKNSSCTPSTTLNLTEAALNGHTVVVTCTSSAFASGVSSAGVTTNSNAYVITASDSYGLYGKPDYVRRVMSATFTNAN